MVVASDKGVAMVILDKEDYTGKVLSLLADTSTYNIINKDPLQNLKTNLHRHLGTSNKQEDLVTQATKNVPSQCCPPKVLWPPQNTYPLGPNVSIHLLVGQSLQHLKTVNILCSTYKR